MQTLPGINIQESHIQQLYWNNRVILQYKQDENSSINLEYDNGLGVHVL